MITAPSRVNVGYNGIDPEKWAIVGATAKITITTEVSALSNHGHWDIISNSNDIASLDLMELTHTKTHKDSMGGGKNMVGKVGELFYELSDISEVFYYNSDQDHVYVLVFLMDHDDLSNQIADVQDRAYDLYPDEFFEVRYVMADRFNKETLPRNAKKINKKG